MSRTVLGVFDSAIEAENAVRDFLRLGITPDCISLVLNEKADLRGDLQQSARTTPRAHLLKKRVEAGIAAGTRRRPLSAPSLPAALSGGNVGVERGALWGGLAGMLAGLTLLAVPGIGPVIAAGPIAGILQGGLGGAGLGAIVGGLVGGLARLGIPADDAALYMAGVVRSGTLVAVTLPATDVNPITITCVAEIMQHHNGVDIRRHTSADDHSPLSPAGGGARRRPLSGPLPLRIFARVAPIRRWVERGHRIVDAVDQRTPAQNTESRAALEQLDTDCDMGSLGRGIGETAG